jgi:hypothetical protein
MVVLADEAVPSMDELAPTLLVPALERIFVIVWSVSMHLSDHSDLGV